MKKTDKAQQRQENGHQGISMPAANETTIEQSNLRSEKRVELATEERKAELSPEHKNLMSEEREERKLCSEEVQGSKGRTSTEEGDQAGLLSTDEKRSVDNMSLRKDEYGPRIFGMIYLPTTIYTKEPRRPVP